MTDGFLSEPRMLPVLVNVLGLVDMYEKGGPRTEVRGPLYLVVLASTKPNTLSIGTKRSHQRQPAPPVFRSRITVKLRGDIVELYESGLSAIAVAERLGIGKSTVLKILKQEGSAVRPPGKRIG